MGVVRIGGNVEKVKGNEISYKEFTEKYMSKNQPVVLTGLMHDWLACKDWVDSNSGLPTLHFFSSHFPSSKVQVADCGAREFTDQKRAEMKVSEFVHLWMEAEQLDGGCGGGESVLYLKDWHFVKEYPEYIAYTTPPFFCDDWLNIYLDHYRMHKDSGSYGEDSDITCSDYRFVYMGAKGSWTPLHADVFRSYSWSSNVCGKKKWLFLSPSQSHLVFDRHGKSSVYNIFDDVSETTFPGFTQAIWLECIQEPGEIIFVPSGWYHQVHNLEDTISINHNWFNGYNLSWVWDLLLKDYKEAKEYIEDIRDICDDFEDICQRNLAANTGMNFFDFFVFLSRLFLANLVLLVCHHGDNISSKNPTMINQQLAFNIDSIHWVVLKMKSVHDEAGNDGFFLDLMETLHDPKFAKLCVDLGRTYGMIHGQQDHSYETIEASIAGLLEYKSQIHSLEEFVDYIDYTLQKLNHTCSEKYSPN